MIHQASPTALSSADLDPGSGAGNVIPFPLNRVVRASAPVAAAIEPPVAAPPRAPLPSCGDTVLALRQASAQLTAAFQLLRANARALEDSCRVARVASDEIAAYADTMATRTDALVDSVRSFRTRLVALADE
jgi:hypothetical protein